MIEVFPPPSCTASSASSTFLFVFTCDVSRCSWRCEGAPWSLRRVPSRTRIRRPGGAARNACSTAGEKGRGRGRDRTKKREVMNTTFPFSTPLLRRPSNGRQTAIKTLVSARRSSTKRYRSEGNLPLLLLSAGSIEISLRSRLAKTPVRRLVRRLDSRNLTVRD